MKRQSWGRKPNLRQLAAAEKHRKLMVYTAIYGGGAGVFMMTMAAIANTFH